VLRLQLLQLLLQPSVHAMYGAGGGITWLEPTNARSGALGGMCLVRRSLSCFARSVDALQLVSAFCNVVLSLLRFTGGCFWQMTFNIRKYGSAEVLSCGRHPTSKNWTMTLRSSVSFWPAQGGIQHRSDHPVTGSPRGMVLMLGVGIRWAPFQQATTGWHRCNLPGPP